MAANKKLTGVIAGRAIAGLKSEGGVATVTFDDGSVMTVKTASDSGGGSAAAWANAQGAKVKAVRQAGTRLSLDTEDGKTVEFETAEATSSVVVRDKSGALEYVD